jgi:2-methylcitrate dehydratase PrpD
MPKVTVEPDDRQDPARPGAAPYDLVLIKTRDGQQLVSEQITDERGSPDRPLSPEELWAKFSECLSVGDPNLPTCAIFDALMAIERKPAVSAIRSLSDAA